MEIWLRYSLHYSSNKYYNLQSTLGYNLDTYNISFANYEFS